MNNFKDYQEAALRTAIYPTSRGVEYCAFGLTNEAGEVAGVIKKFLRGDYDQAEASRRLKKELGDTMWYLAALAKEAGFTLEEIAADNINKLYKRQQEGTLQGDGDDR